MGPAGLLNKISSTATSNIDEVGLVTMTYSFAGRFAWALLILCLTWLTRSEVAAAVISEEAMDLEYEVID